MRQRSRQKSNPSQTRKKKYKQKQQQDQQNNSSQSDNNSEEQRLKYWRKQKWQDRNQEYDGFPTPLKIMQQITIEPAKVYLIWKYPKQKNVSSMIAFSIKVEKGKKPPQKQFKQSKRICQLKDQISPIKQIWSSTIKQYLNDSQFIQIHRKGKSLAYGSVQYGKSIIKYDGLDAKGKVDDTRKNGIYCNNKSQQNIFSRAYFKITEILNLGILKNKKNQQIVIVNLAEGPGGFIHALIDYRLKQNQHFRDTYHAITLKIQQGKTRHAKDWSDYRANRFFQKMQQKGYQINLTYGLTNDGDLLNMKNITSFKNYVMDGKQAFLVTGDGGIQCIGDQEFHVQQVFNAKLFLSEILTALKIQKIGGTFILKIYDIHYAITQQLIMLICLFYRKVGIVKPLTSRPGNSQKYILCQDFIGCSSGSFQKLAALHNQWIKSEQKLSYFMNEQFIHSILSFNPQSTQYPDFIQKIMQRIATINKQLTSQQQQKIQKGLELVKKHQKNVYSIKKQIQQKRYQQQIDYAYAWCQKYHMANVETRQQKRKDNLLL